MDIISLITSVVTAYGYYTFFSTGIDFGTKAYTAYTYCKSFAGYLGRKKIKTRINKRQFYYLSR